MSVQGFVRHLPLLLLAGSCACGSFDRSVVKSPGAPAAIGPYSQGVVTNSGRTLYAAGQVGIDPATGKLAGDDLESQTERALDNLGAVLEAAQMDFGDVVFATIYLTAVEDYPRVNEIYAKRFSGQPPARATVAVAALPANAKVEIQLIAVAR
jgi:2-iminobutanoate/2-iminopropanoate deaminase